MPQRAISFFNWFLCDSKELDPKAYAAIGYWHILHNNILAVKTNGHFSCLVCFFFPAHLCVCVCVCVFFFDSKFLLQAL